jgi:hypothetical protein
MGASKCSNLTQFESFVKDLEHNNIDLVGNPNISANFILNHSEEFPSIFGGHLIYVNIPPKKMIDNMFTLSELEEYL